MITEAVRAARAAQRFAWFSLALSTGSLIFAVYVLGRDLGWW